MSNEMLQIIHPAYGHLGYTDRSDIEKARTRGVTQVVLRRETGERLVDFRDRLTPGLRAAFDKDNTSLTVHIGNLEASDLVPVGRRYKVQTKSRNGWGDVKSAQPDGTFVLSSYATKRQAGQAAAKLPGWADGEYRVVPIATRSDDDLYPKQPKPGEAMMSLFLTRPGHDHLLSYAPDVLNALFATKTQQWSIEGVRFTAPADLAQSAFNELPPRMGLLSPEPNESQDSPKTRIRP